MTLTNKLYEPARKLLLTGTAVALTGLASLLTPAYLCFEVFKIKIELKV